MIIINNHEVMRDYLVSTQYDVLTLLVDTQKEEVMFN